MAYIRKPYLKPLYIGKYAIYLRLVKNKYSPSRSK